ncbi:MAG: MBL fold metallo-hydrolase [Methylococcaceae bacterium]|nr:MBL fold metallo-hydrolase [Methylococcaceae bacterium]
MSLPLRLRDDVRLQVHYCDETPFGSAITGLCDKVIYRTCEPIVQLGREHGTDYLREHSAQLLEQCFSAQALGQMYTRPGVLREDCLYPPADGVRPIALSVASPDLPPRVCRVDASLWHELARWIEAWSSPGRRPQSPKARALWDDLEAAGAFTTQPVIQPRCGEGLTFVGHATVALQSSGTRILFDPFLLPPAYGSPSGYRPWLAAELAPHAVFITHSHPDHYDVGTLLRLGAETPIYVPYVERESLLAVDMCARLRELGFGHVTALHWGQEVQIGPHRVKACPFYGEQPSDREVFHPEARNAGNVYVVDSQGRRVALVADAGRDPTGDCRQLAERECGEVGPVDTVLGGYRAWRLHPVQYLPTSVARYLLFVPPEQWDRRLQVMNDADDLLETAVRWGARRVIPYANGGAPWYWDLGLGPGLNASDSDFDPDLHAIAKACEARRREGKGIPQVVALHPGEQLHFGEGGKEAVRVRVEDHIWPFFDHTALFSFPSVRWDEVQTQDA